MLHPTKITFEGYKRAGTHRRVKHTREGPAGRPGTGLSEYIYVHQTRKPTRRYRTGRREAFLKMKLNQKINIISNEANRVNFSNLKTRVQFHGVFGLRPTLNA